MRLFRVDGLVVANSPNHLSTFKIRLEWIGFL
jgi:hypothetical protein